MKTQKTLTGKDYMDVLKANPGLDEAGYQRILDSMPRPTPSAMGEIRAGIFATKVLAQQKMQTVAALRVIEEFETDAASLKIGRCDCSRLHKLEEAFHAGNVYSAESGEYLGPDEAVVVNGAQVFVIRDDWAALVQDEGHVELPAPHCAFEMLIGDVPLICIAAAHEGVRMCQGFVLAGGVWIAMGSLGETSNLMLYAREQMVAALIAIEAEVVEHTVIRQPVALNAKRERSGKLPMYDYHVVNLARRHRVANASDGHSGRHVRLHFRRGHWRHYEASKTWIKWCLVGDPSLGIVGKEYRL